MQIQLKYNRDNSVTLTGLESALLPFKEALATHGGQHEEGPAHGHLLTAAANTA